MSWKEDTIRFNAIAKDRILCKCGYSMTLSNHSRICRNCGKMILTKKEQEIKDKELFNANLKRALERKCI